MLFIEGLALLLLYHQSCDYLNQVICTKEWILEINALQDWSMKRCGRQNGSGNRESAMKVFSYDHALIHNVGF